MNHLTRHASHALLGATALLGALAAAPALATMVVQPSLDQMTARANVIVHGVVADRKVVAAEHGRILTLTQLRVTDGIKGARTGGTLTVYQVGGVLDGRVARIAGVSEFAVGEEVILFGDTFLATDTVDFLKAERKDVLPAGMLSPSEGWIVPYGIGLGKFVVTRAPGTEPMAVEELGDVTPVTVNAQGGVQHNRAVMTRQPLRVFVEEVRRLVREGSRP